MTFLDQRVGGDMSSIEFFFDPICPFAWVTSRWVQEVRTHREVEVGWRFISLEVVNAPQFDKDEAAVARGEEPTLPPQYRDISRMGNRLLRVAAALRDAEGNDTVEAFYTAVGTRLHNEGLSARLWKGDADLHGVLDELLDAAGVSHEVRQRAEDDRWAQVVRDETRLALSRTGEDVGTPIITWDLHRPDEASLFGPVISRIPRGEEAVRLWDAVETVALTPGIAEFKRSQRAELNFD
jgi:predicted DsbA family dithiol-disulfide isomerase